MMNTTATFRVPLVLKGSAVTYRGHGGNIKGRVIKLSRKGVATVKWTDKTEERIVVDALELWDQRWVGNALDIVQDRLYAEQWDPDYVPVSGCGSP